MRDYTQPLVVIAGPTASGKTALAIQIAEEFGGEIICADSRTIYKDMDIGTAKPTAEERARVPHWGLDIVEPGEYFSAADFKVYANERIADIRSRGKLPMLVGGTGLYIDGVVFDYQFGAQADWSMRERFEKLTIDELHNHCQKNNIPLPENTKNKRYLIRAIEQSIHNKQGRTEPIERTIIVGIATDREVLRTRIRTRAEQLFENGIVDEAIVLGEKYGWQNEAMTGNIYRLAKRYHDGTLSLNELKEAFITADWRLAKRQLTWLKRNQFVHWLALDEAEIYLREQLAKTTAEMLQ